MKNQYFGDNKDLFTYDLICHIMSHKLVKHLTLIPLLTENDNKGHGNICNRSKVKAGTKNTGLIKFLDDCIRNNKRNIGQLASFFARCGVKMEIYREDHYFTHKNRREYFQGISDKLLRHSLVFVDPDIGLEVKNPGKEHLLYSEVSGLYNRMSRDSILMLFQHFPRINREQYLNMRIQEIKEKVLGEEPVCLDDDQAIFFFLTRDDEQEHRLIQVIGEYAEGYSNRESPN